MPENPESTESIVAAKLAADQHNQAVDSAAESKKEHRGWIGVDLDGTLAHYDGWNGPTHIGEPVPAMLRRVKAWLAEGRDVRIFTARVWHDRTAERYESASLARLAIEAWVETHVGQKLPITCEKDYGMVELYDDRCKFVFPNSGITHEEHMGFHQAMMLEVAEALGVKVETGMNFHDVGKACAARARAGTAKADKAEKILALLDGCSDSLNYVKPCVAGVHAEDLNRALRQIDKALPLLRELAGVEGGK